MSLAGASSCSPAPATGATRTSSPSRARSRAASITTSAAATNMGQAGDLLLIFADQLVRSWKQITKFKPAGAAPQSAPLRAPLLAGAALAGDGLARAPEAPTFSLEGLIRDERGVRLAPEAED